MTSSRFDLGSTSKTLNLSFLRFNERSGSENFVYKSVYVPSVDNVWVLYRLLWILAVVVVNAFLGNAFA